MWRRLSVAGQQRPQGPASTIHGPAVTSDSAQSLGHWGKGHAGVSKPRHYKRKHLSRGSSHLGHIRKSWHRCREPGRSQVEGRSGSGRAEEETAPSQRIFTFYNRDPCGAGHRLPSTRWEGLVSAAPCTPSASLTAAGRAAFRLPHKLVNNTEPTLSKNCCFSPPSTSGRPHSLLHKALWCHQRTETAAWCLNWFHLVLSETGSGLQGSFTLSNLDVKPDPLVLHPHRVHPRAGQTP